MMPKKIALSLIILSITFSTTGFALTTHQFASGDTLWDLAAKHYGDPTLYPVLLEVNGIDNPRTIPTGKTIIIPDKDQMKEIATEKDPTKKQRLIVTATSGVRPDETSTNTSTNTQTQNGQEFESRYSGDTIRSSETSFKAILKGPKVGGEKLIKYSDQDKK